MKRTAFLVCFAAVAAVAMLLVPCQTARADIAQAIDATCRVKADDGGVGSGCVFEISQGQVYILTCAHVATGRIAHCEFWQEGHQSSPLRGEVILRSPQVDAAVIAVPVESFAGRLPAAIPIAERATVLQIGETLTSVGCAKGAWSTGWKGHALKYEAGDLLFTPPPANGRSGSAVFDGEATRIVGLIRARTETGGGEMYGRAVGLQSLYAAMDREVASRLTQCGPGGCPMPVPTPKYRALPYRQQNEAERFRDRLGQQNQTPWPTLPPPTPVVPVTPFQPLAAPLAPPSVLAPTVVRDEPSPLLISLLAFAAMAIGAALFFGTQKHTE